MMGFFRAADWQHLPQAVMKPHRTRGLLASTHLRLLPLRDARQVNYAGIYDSLTDSLMRNIASLEALNRESIARLGELRSLGWDEQTQLTMTTTYGMEQGSF